MRGASWTEPTVYAVLALLAAGESQPAERGLDWLRSRQLRDGGWPPQAGFDESNWVTALAALIPAGHLGEQAHARSIEWLMGTVGEESTLSYRVRRWLLGDPNPITDSAGWPWVKETASWVTPTSLAILALDKENSRRPDERLRKRIAAGRRYLVERMCLKGGWNHGSVRVYGAEGLPYPETTGLALAALRGISGESVDLSIAVARRFLTACRSADALNWLRVGLMAHRQLPPDYTPPELAYRTLTETSLCMLAAETQKGREIFWS